MFVAPPLKKRPTWNVPITVPWSAKVSGSTSVACWLVAFVYGSALTWMSETFAPATPVSVSNAAVASAAGTAAHLVRIRIGFSPPF
jgi:hypothetical protein